MKRSEGGGVEGLKIWWEAGRRTGKGRGGRAAVPHDCRREQDVTLKDSL